MTGRLLTTREVAHQLGLDIQTVRTQIRRGDLPAINLSTGRRPTWRVEEKALAAYIANRAA